MNKPYFLIVLMVTFFTLETNAQISFEPGYYIDNDGKRTDCLIKNIDWKNNPTDFEIKPTADAEKQVLSIDAVQEFGIANTIKFVRAQVNIDRSSDFTASLTTNKAPVFTSEKLYLKVLIEGDASLYVYADKSLTRYFFKINDREIEQLVYRKYLTADDKVAVNTDFRQQLFYHLKCATITALELNNLDYYKKSLTNVFISYNTCKNAQYVDYNPKVKRDLFNLNVRPGVNYSSLAIDNNNFGVQDVDYGSQLTFRMGLEFEFIMGFNKNKWAIIIEPTYQYFKSDGPVTRNFSNLNADYESIEFPLGIRHYIFLNDGAKVFVNASVIYDVPLSSTVRNLDISPNLNAAIGAGFKYANKYSVEMRYHTERNVLNDFLLWHSDYSTMSVIFGYTLF